MLTNFTYYISVNLNICDQNVFGLKGKHDIGKHIAKLQISVPNLHQERWHMALAIQRHQITMLQISCVLKIILRYFFLMSHQKRML